MILDARQSAFSRTCPASPCWSAACGSPTSAIGASTNISSSARSRPKNLDEAQKGVVFAAYLKLLMPVIIVFPGIAAVVLAPDLAKPDQAYPTMMQLLPPGLLGLVFAALIAAIIASTASKINSIATIFTLDLYAKARGMRSTRRRRCRRQRAAEKHLVFVGRIVAGLAMVIALLTARPLLGKLRPGLPVHPGILRLLHAGDHRHLPARPVLEAGDGGRRDRRRGRIGRAVLRLQDGDFPTSRS